MITPRYFKRGKDQEDGKSVIYWWDGKKGEIISFVGPSDDYPDYEIRSADWGLEVPISQSIGEGLSSDKVLEMALRHINRKIKWETIDMKHMKKIRVRAHRRKGIWVRSHASSRLVGSSNTPRDRIYIAKPPGKRISSSGKPYYEHRRNRADANRKRRL